MIFEERYKKLAIKENRLEKQKARNQAAELNSECDLAGNVLAPSNYSNSNVREQEQDNTQVITTLTEIKESAGDIETKLRNIGMIKGYVNILNKLKNDMEKHIENFQNGIVSTKESDHSKTNPYYV